MIPQLDQENKIFPDVCALPQFSTYHPPLLFLLSGQCFAHQHMWYINTVCIIMTIYVLRKVFHRFPEPEAHSDGSEFLTLIGFRCGSTPHVAGAVRDEPAGNTNTTQLGGRKHHLGHFVDVQTCTDEKQAKCLNVNQRETKSCFQVLSLLNLHHEKMITKQNCCESAANSF